MPIILIKKLSAKNVVVSHPSVSTHKSIIFQLDSDVLLGFYYNQYKYIVAY